MNIAIIGAGYAGLALGWHLLKIEGCRVTFFDVPKEGASKISSGLLHPYPGEQASRSWKAEEALLATKELLNIARCTLNRPVANDQGILRFAIDERQKKQLIERTQTFSDIERVGEKEFLIHSGMTVYSSLYLQGLQQACKEKGAVFYPILIQTNESLKDYDRIILACGSDVLRFPECRDLNLKHIKGQMLVCQWPCSLPPLQRSLIGKGHVAVEEDPALCVVGATYEKGPAVEDVAALLFPKIRAFFPQIAELKIIERRVGIRVTREGSYLPLIQKINDKIWVFTALGSRGLLYHAYFAEILAQSVIEQDSKVFSSQ